MSQTQMKNWSKKDIPSLNGKSVIVTGGTGGLGYEIALGLAEAGATVIITGRNETKGNEAVEKIKKIFPQAKISFERVDLTSIASVKEFAQRFNSKNEALDILMNNAGVGCLPKRTLTEDGFENTFATNHLGPFVLTAQLMPSLKRSSAPRVINISSGVAKRGRIHFDDLQLEKSYDSITPYAQSKLANLLFTFEMQRKSEKENWGVKVFAAHPGVCKTDGISSGPGKWSLIGVLATFIVIPFFGHSVSNGALPPLYAATSEEAQPGGYYGPQGFQELNGPVGSARIPDNAKDMEVAEQLWDISLSLTGVSWS